MKKATSVKPKPRPRLSRLPEILPPIYDLIFKLVFAKCPDLLRQLLQALINLPPGEFGKVVVVDPNVYPEYNDGKSGVLDIKVTLRSKKIVNVEMQQRKIAHLRERVLYYCAGMIGEQVVRSDKYSNIKRVVSITIANHTVIPDNEYHHRYTLFDPKTGSEFTDLLEVHLIELPKLPKTGDDSDMWWWMKFLTTNTKEGLTMIAEKKPSLKKAVERLWTVSEDKSIRARMKSIRMFEMDQRVIRDEAVEEGVEKGLKKGRREGRQEGRQEGVEEVFRLLEQGYTPAQAKKMLNITRPTTAKKRTTAARRG
ncbi:hypothetical protein R80B4_00545 [Fibrobacteres bacterium R8-0-B4]